MRHTAVAIAFCIGPIAPGYAQDIGAIQAMNDRFAAAFNQGDVKTVSSMYTEDAYILPPAMEAMQGRKAIQAFWEGATQQLADLQLTAVDVKPLGDSAAREIGRATAKTKGDSPQDVTIKYVVIWEKEGEDWRIATDIWNQ